MDNSWQDPHEWQYVAEGNQNLIVRRVSSGGTVMRLRKRTGEAASSSDAGVRSDHEFASTVMAPLLGIAVTLA